MKCEDCKYTIPCYQGKLLLGTDKSELCVRCGKFFPDPTKYSHWTQPKGGFVCELRRVTPELRQRCEGDDLRARTSFNIDDPGPSGGKICVTTCLECRRKGKPLRATIGDLCAAKNARSR